MLRFHIRLISVFGNTEFKLTVMCNLYSIFSCISILKSCKPILYCSLNDRADFCTTCHMVDEILMDKIGSSLKFLSIVLPDRLYSSVRCNFVTLTIS